MLKQRDMEVTFNLPPNPFIRSGRAIGYSFLISKTDTELVIGVRNTQYGFPFADALEALRLFEIRQIDKESKQIVFRYSWSVDWIHKYFLIAGVAEQMAYEKLLATAEFSK